MSFVPLLSCLAVLNSGEERQKTACGRNGEGGEAGCWRENEASAGSS
jgi:hypothetical protein